MTAGGGSETIVRELRKLRGEIEVMLSNQTAEMEQLIKASSLLSLGTHNFAGPIGPAVMKPSVPGTNLSDIGMDHRKTTLSDVEMDHRKTTLSDVEMDHRKTTLSDVEMDHRKTNLSDVEMDHRKTVPTKEEGHRRTNYCRQTMAVDHKESIKVPGRGGITGLKRGKTEQKLDQAIYDVANLYKVTGISQALARSELFERITLFVIAINALYIGIDAELNTAETMITAAPPFIICDNLFCIFFTFELTVRFAAFRYKRNCLRDTWFVFDSFLVALMVGETWILSCVLLMSGAGGGENGLSLPTGPLRLLRLLRLSRLVRLLRAMPELLVLVNGIKVAARAVWSSLLMIFMMNYVMAIMLHMFLKEVPDLDEQFRLLTLTMWTLFMDGTFMDSTKATLNSLRNVAETDALLSIYGVAMFVFYILMTNITVMNMLIGILCEVVAEVKKFDDEKSAIQVMQKFLRDMLMELDEDKNGRISRTELANVVQNPKAVAVLEKLEVNPQYVMDLTEALFEEDQDAGRVPEVTREELMEVILKIRGNRDLSMQDLVEVQVDLRRLMNRNIRKMEEAMKLLHGSLAVHPGLEPLALPGPAVPVQVQPPAVLDSGGADDNNNDKNLGDRLNL